MLNSILFPIHFQSPIEAFNLICNKMQKLEYLYFRGDATFPEKVTVPLSIADKDKFLNLGQIEIRFEAKYRSEAENRFKRYLSAKCPNLRNPIHVVRVTDLDKYEVGFHRYWTNFESICTENCTDTQHNDLDFVY